MNEDSIRTARRRQRARDSVSEILPVEVRPSPSSPFGIHVLCWKRDYREAMWALASLLSFAVSGPAVTVHVDGELPADGLEMLREGLPGATIWSAEAADDVVGPQLASDGFHRLRELRDRDPLARKLVDVVVLGTSSIVTYLDSDVLVFAPPTHLIPTVGQLDGATDRTLRYMLDTEQSTTVTPAEARSFGLPMAPLLNSGVLRFPRRAVDLSRFDYWLGIDALNQGGFFVEQTLWSLLAAEIDGEPLPASYALSTGSAGGVRRDVVHYTSPHRALLYDEGIPRLVDGGLSGRLARRASAPRAPGLT